MTENQITILNLLVEMNKFRLERILTLSVFRMKFSQYLKGETANMKAKEMVAFSTWDDMELTERTQVAIEFLKVESVKQAHYTHDDCQK